MKKYRYTLKSTGHSSAKFGLCEVCGKHVSEVFVQTEMQFYEDEFGSGWTYYECEDYFGHERCLRSKRGGNKMICPRCREHWAGFSENDFVLVKEKGFIPKNPEAESRRCIIFNSNERAYCSECKEEMEDREYNFDLVKRRES